MFQVASGVPLVACGEPKVATGAPRVAYGLPIWHLGHIFNAESGIWGILLISGVPIVAQEASEWHQRLPY